MIKREWVMGVLAALLLASITYGVGRKTGTTNEKLAQNKLVIRVADSVTKAVTARLLPERAHADSVLVEHTVVREKVRVQHDSILVHDSVVAVSPEVAQLIQSDDSTIAALRRVVVQQDTLILALRKGIALRDTRIQILEESHSPRFGIKSGIVAGVVLTALIVRAAK